MKNITDRILTVKERYKFNGELLKVLKKYMGIKKLGFVQELKIAAEINEPTIIELKIQL